MKFIFSILLLTCSSYIFSQWTSKSPVIGDPKNHPVTFTIDSIGYAATGYNTKKQALYQDVIKYNPRTDSWTALKDFPGGARGLGAGASYNGKGYLGFGVGTGGYFKDLWEYSPESDTWKQLASLPGLARRHPCFSITENGKLYVGLGDGPDENGDFDPGFKDFWEYDIASNSWTQMPDLPAAGRHHPYHFAIGNDVYVGFGDNHAVIFKDFYKLSSISKTWTKLTDFPGESRVAGAQFAFGGNGYIVDGEGSDHQNLDEGELHRYDPNNDTWTTLAYHSGDGLWAPGAFVIDSLVYVVGGDDDDDNTSTITWAYSLEQKPVDKALSENNGMFTLSPEFFDEQASYQWIDCGNNNEPLAGEQNPNILIPAGKSYALVVTYSEGGVDTSDCYQATATGIASNATKSFVAYPNPASDVVHLQGVSPSYGYNLISSNGQLALAGVFNSSGSIQVKSLKKGAYILQIKNENGIVISSQSLSIVGD